MFRHRVFAATLSFSAVAACTNALDDPALRVEAEPVALTEPTDIRLKGLEPGQIVTLTATRRSDWNDGLIRSTSRFAADDGGVVSTMEDAPVDAAWEGVDAYGPFWSMRATEETSPRDTSRIVDIAADLDGDGAADLNDIITLRTGEDEVTETVVDPDFPGAFILRPDGHDGERLPLIVYLGGSEGGDGAARKDGPPLAIQGYAVLGLPYYSPAYWGGEAQFPDLPRAFANLPVDYVAAAVAAIDDPMIDTTRVALVGVSKGAELALLSGSLSGGVCAVAAIVPSDVVWEGWGPGSVTGETAGFSWRGEPLAFVPYEGMGATIAALSRGESVSLRTPHDDGRAANPETVEAARIRVEDINAPVFLLGGDADTTWDSGGMARNIAATRAAAGRETDLRVYENGTHGLSGSAYKATQRANAMITRETWPALLSFLERSFEAPACGNG